MTSKHIVIVDDDPCILEILERYLASRKYRVTIARRASVARAVFLRDHVDLLLADARLPGENGIELARGASELGIPSLIMSGDRDWAIAQGAVSERLLLKPFGLQIAQRLIQEALAA